jgi:hypothetical protein
MSKPRKAEIASAAAALGRLGGNARAAALTADERRAAATAAIRARWGDRPKCPCGKYTLEKARRRNHRCG